MVINTIKVVYSFFNQHLLKAYRTKTWSVNQVQIEERVDLFLHAESGRLKEKEIDTVPTLRSV